MVVAPTSAARANFAMTAGVSFRDLVVRRRMVRAFTDEPVDPALVDELLDLARRAPSAGNSQGTAFVVLDSPEAVAGYWDLTLPGERRAAFGWPGLLDAPVLVVAVCSPEAYVERYAEADKAATGLGEGAAAWPVPYWFVDAGMALEHVLLGAVEAGLGACLFGLFEHERGVLRGLGVPAGWRAVGTVALGHPAPDRPGLLGGDGPVARCRTSCTAAAGRRAAQPGAGQPDATSTSASINASVCGVSRPSARLGWSFQNGPLPRTRGGSSSCTPPPDGRLTGFAGF